MSQKLVTIASCLAVALASLLSAVFVVNPGLVKAYKSPGSPSGFVNDFAGVIDDTVQTVLESDLSAFSDSTSNQIVVATVNSLEGDSIENFANELFREWGVGGHLLFACWSYFRPDAWCCPTRAIGPLHRPAARASPHNSRFHC